MMPFKVMRAGKPILYATVTAGGSQITTASGNKQATITASVGGRLFAAIVATNQKASNGSIADNLGGTWTFLVEGTNSSPNRGVALWYRQEALTDTSTLTVTYAPGTLPTTDTGNGLQLFRVDGLSSWSIPQTAFATDPGDMIPQIAFGAAPRANSCLIGIVVGINLNAGVPAGWTSAFAGSFSSPATFTTAAKVDRSLEGSVVTWGSTSIQGWCGCMIEVNPG